MSTICSVFLWMELLSNNEYLWNFLIILGFVQDYDQTWDWWLQSVFSLCFHYYQLKELGQYWSFCYVLIILVYHEGYYVPSFYSPPRRVIQFIIPFPLFKYLVQEDMKRSVIETKAKPQKQTQGPRIITIKYDWFVIINCNSHVASEMQNPEYPQPSEPIQEKSEKPSRFKGTGRILYLLVWLCRQIRYIVFIVVCFTLSLQSLWILVFWRRVIL